MGRPIRRGQAGWCGPATAVSVKVHLCIVSDSLILKQCDIVTPEQSMLNNEK